MDEILADHTDRDIADVEASTQRDTFMSAKEALVYGMIDRIMERDSSKDPSLDPIPRSSVKVGRGKRFRGLVLRGAGKENHVGVPDSRTRRGLCSCPMRVSRSAYLLGIMVLSACFSTVVSKTGLDPAVGVQMGNAYSGVRLNLKSWRCLPSVAGGYSPAAKLVFLPVSASLLVVDLLVSVVADTVMFPIDLMVAPSGKSIRPLMDECD